MSHGDSRTGPSPDGSGTVGAGGGSQPISQIVIPPLHGDERIEDWEPVYRAAVTLLLLRQDDQKLAVGLLHSHVNLRPAEMEIMKEVLQKDTLDAAFELLRTLDDPIVLKIACRSCVKLCSGKIRKWNYRKSSTGSLRIKTLVIE